MAELSLEKATVPFDELAARFGFDPSARTDTRVEYRRGSTFFRVRFDLTRSFEVGVEVGHGERVFNLGEVLRWAGVDDAGSWAQVTEQGPLERAVAQMAEALQLNGQRLLRGDAHAFADLAKFSSGEAVAYQHAKDLQRAVQSGREAWQRGSYAEVVAALAPFESDLADSDRKRLEMARRR